MEQGCKTTYSLAFIFSTTIPYHPIPILSFALCLCFAHLMHLIIIIIIIITIILIPIE